VGISTDKFDLIFKKFSQLEDTDTRRYQGIGLGLPIIKSMVERHDGNIWLKSKKGQGTEFAFSIPILSVEQKTSKLLDEKIRMSHQLAKELLAVSITIPFTEDQLASSWMGKFSTSVAPMIAAKLLRPTDVSYYFQEKSLLFLLFMGVKNQHAETIVKRMEKALLAYMKEMSDDVPGHLKTSSVMYPQDADSCQALIELLNKNKPTEH
jgi:hypothetical protein